MTMRGHLATNLSSGLSSSSSCSMVGVAAAAAAAASEDNDGIPCACGRVRECSMGARYLRDLPS